MKLIPWIPIFGGVYCNFDNPSYWFKDSFSLMAVNFIYHLCIAAAILLILN